MTKILKICIEKKYPEVETIVKYLENENKFKTDLGVKSPTKNISKDVAEFEKKYSEIHEFFTKNVEDLIRDNDLPNLLKKTPHLK